MRHRLSPRDQADDLAFDLLLQAIDFRIARYHVSRHVVIVPVYGSAGIQDHGFHDPAHTHQVCGDLFKFVCEGGNNMF